MRHRTPDVGVEEIMVAWACCGLYKRPELSSTCGCGRGWRTGGCGAIEGGWGVVTCSGDDVGEEFRNYRGDVNFCQLQR
uniref:Uncharacterized protein n=1 Tax=Oryza sativa subsp. japonica TaxID=39947 RepID=Q6Z2D8_ORYSJ|nr:hypothetical protein [Oryza sativa Japonica Group]